MTEQEKVVPEGGEPAPVEPEKVSTGYSKDFVDKLMREKNNWREKALGEEAAKKKYEEEKLLAEQKYQEVAELKEREASDWKSKYEHTQKVITDSVKTNSIKKELHKLGMSASYMDHAIKMIDLGSVKIDPDTNTVYGHESAANQIKEMFPPLFGVTMASVDHSAPNVEHKNIDIDAWKNMSHDDKIKYEEQLYKSLGILRK